MVEWRLIKLNFKDSAAHFGEIGIGLEETSERVRSDTLFSAMISIYARLYPEEIESLLQEFQKPIPPFRHSSTFIYRRSKTESKPNNDTYYLPKPMVFPQGYPDDDLKFSKAYKKLNYLPLNLWQRWYQGQGFDPQKDAEELENTAQKKVQPEGTLEKSGVFCYGKTYQTQKLPKVAIDRMSSATNFYQTGVVHFENNAQCQSGLYFLFQFPEANLKLEHRLKAVLNLLGEEGLGGERSSGAGRFTDEWLDLPKCWQTVINFSDKTLSHSLISLFWNHPQTSTEIQRIIEAEQSVSYNVIERGGWVSSSPSGIQKRRQKIRMFEEGSVFSFQPQGALADVTPDRFRGGHPVYRSGLALSLPIRWGK